MLVKNRWLRAFSFLSIHYTKVTFCYMVFIIAFESPIIEMNDYVYGDDDMIVGICDDEKNVSSVNNFMKLSVDNELKKSLQVDVSYKDVKMLLRKVEEGITQASSGNKVLGIKISADYVLSQKINLQLFYDHQGTTPLISSSYPVKADNVGLNIKLMLTR